MKSFGEGLKRKEDTNVYVIKSIEILIQCK